MFDIGFAELLVIAVVGLLVIGPERLPGAVRTGAAWLNRLRRSVSDIKREVEQELHNDKILQDLRRTGSEVQREAAVIRKDISGSVDAVIGDSDSTNGDATVGKLDQRKTDHRESE